MRKSHSQKQINGALEPLKSPSPKPYIKIKEQHHVSRRRGPTHTENIVSPAKRVYERDLQSEADNLLQGQCKIIFLPKQELMPLDNIGFRTFSEMMKTNTAWAQQAASLSGNRFNSDGEPEFQQTPVGQFPIYLTNRLKFNKSQTENFRKSMDLRWDNTLNKMEQLGKKYTRSPKVKLIQHENKSRHDSDEEKDLKGQLDKLDQDAKNHKLRNLRLFWYSITMQEQWKPSTREGCTITYLESQHKCLLYGGIGRELFNNFIQLNTRNWAWLDIGPGTGDVPLGGRFGHSTTYFKKQMVIFGGERKYNASLKMRECYSDVRVYNPQNHSWTYLRTYGDVAEARRNHVAVCCGRFFFVLGGVNSYGKYLSDIVSLNLDTLKWVHYDTDGFYQDGLAFSSALSIFPADIRLDNPYQSYEYIRKKGKKMTKLGDEGIFIFGGRLGSGEASDELRLVKLGSKPLIVKKVETKGLGPSARYMHSMNYFEPMNVCVIYGGRDDSIQSKGSNIKNDMFVLDMETFNWIQVTFIGMPEVGKCSHASAFLESKLLIFGGYSSDSFKNSDIQFVELDQAKTRSMLKEIRNRNKGYVNQPIVLTISEIQSDAQLKMFTMDNQVNVGQLIQNEELGKDKQNKFSSTQYNNMKTFQPVPVQEPSNLLKEFKLKKELDKVPEIIKAPSRQIASRQSIMTNAEDAPSQVVSKRLVNSMITARISEQLVEDETE